MTTVSTIIQAAYRETNTVQIGRDPTPEMLAECLSLLNSRVANMFGLKMGEELSDWMVPYPQRTAPVQANFPQNPFPNAQDALMLTVPESITANVNIYPYPPQNSRIVFGSVTSTAYFPESPNDGARMALIQGSGAGDGGSAGNILTLDGNGRTIETAATQDYAAPVTARQWLYRADLGDWRAVVPFVATDDFVFPRDVDDYWVTGLAIRLCPRFGKQASQETTSAFKEAQTHFENKYRQAGTTTFGAQNIPNGRQSYSASRWGTWM